MFKPAVALIFASLALASCQSERPARGEVLHQLNAQCLSYGYKFGTDAFSACVQQSDQARIANNRERRLQSAAALQQWSLQMQQQAQNQQMINAMNRPRTCTTNRFGNTLQTQCY